MPGTTDAYTVRDFARDIIRVFDECGSDTARRLEGIREPVRKLFARPDLLSEKTVPRRAHHIDDSRYLYYDGQLSITLDLMPKGKRVPVHDHGNDRGNHLWEALAIYRGKLGHTVYERADDRSVPGYADLRVVEDRVLGPGEVTIVGPPAEIHDFGALEDGTYSVTIVDGHYPPDRQYFKPEEKKAILTTPTAVREGTLQKV